MTRKVAAMCAVLLMVACTIDQIQHGDIVTNTKPGWLLARETTATTRWHSSYIQKRLARVFLFRIRV